MSLLVISQPQVAQLDLQFPAPLDKHSIVDTFNDLLTLRFNYPHRRVWVKTESCEYFLDVDTHIEGIGNSAEHWKKVTSKSTIDEYSSLKSYQRNDVVMVKLSGKLYKAIDNVPVGSQYSPIRNPRIWQPIVGDVETQIFQIEGQSSIRIVVDQQNPMFRVYETVDDKTFEIDCKISEIIDNSNPEVLGIDVEDDEEDLSDLALNKIFLFEFFEDSQPKEITGYIVMK